jgi:hypothetical protein
MRLELFERAVLTQDLPGEGLCSGDVGVVVEHYAGDPDTPEGYELEFLSARGDTIAVVSVPATVVRPVHDRELLAVRTFGHD